MVIPLQVKQLNQITPFTMYTMHKQQTQLIHNWYNPVNWYLMSLPVNKTLLQLARFAKFTKEQ